MLIAHAFPAYRYQLDSRAADCREEMLVWAERNGHQWCHTVESKPDISWARNLIVEWAFEQGAHLLVMQDADAWAGDNVLPRMLETMVEHCAAVVAPVFAMRSSGRPMVHPQRPGEIYECDTVGSSMLVIDLVTLAHLPRPWFRFRYGKSGEMLEREDLYFCRKVRAHGQSVWADWTIPTHHEGTANV